jgi:hypothetical protein
MPDGVEQLGSFYSYNLTAMGSTLQPPDRLVGRPSARLCDDPYASYVGSRLLEFFADTSPWSRRLWQIGSVLALKEACEAGGWVRERVLARPAVSDYLQHQLPPFLGPDRGLGGSDLRREVIKLLKSGLAPESTERRRMTQLVPAVEDGYLRRWEQAVADTAAATESGRERAASPSPEVLAQAIAGHLLDSGHSSGQLHRWANELIGNADATLGDLLRSARDLAERPEGSFDVLVPFRALSGHAAGLSTGVKYLSAHETAKALADRREEDEVLDREWPLRQCGALSYRVRAKDIIAASRKVGMIVQQLATRTSYAHETRPSFEPVGRVWVRGWPGSLPLRPPSRSVDVRSLFKQKEVYSSDWPTRLDDALEMAAPLDLDPPAPAVSGAWAAVESLLYNPAEGKETQIHRDASAKRATEESVLYNPAEGNENRAHRDISAKRLASIVACSWPRRELAALSYRHRSSNPTSDRLAKALHASHTKLDRCEAVSKALLRGWRLTVEPNDVAAARRIVAVLADPNPPAQLQDVQRIIAVALIRLYRHRNIVVHAGTTSAIALEATLRTAAPLIGAGFDRIVHAWLRWQVDALTLAARAENSIALAGDPEGPTIARLLEWPRPL